MAANGGHRSRRIVVDDTDAAIVYDGSWTVLKGSQVSTGNLGPPYQDTLHGVPDGQSSSFMFQYEGSTVDVYGTVSQNTDVSWECFIDGFSIGTIGFTEPGTSVNRWKLCEFSSADFKTHTLMVNVTTRRDLFQLDYIRYIPLPTYPESSAKAVLQVHDDDPKVVYTGAWEERPNFAHITNTTGSSASFEFFGTSVQWYGFVPVDFSRRPSEAAYSIDGSPPETFSLPIRRNREDPELFNQIFFKTPQLSLDWHRVLVTYKGFGTPLTLNYLLVDNHENSVVATSTTLMAVPTSGSSGAPVTQPGPNGGAIAGGVVGSLLGIALLAFLFCFFRKWNLKRNLPMITPLPGFSKPDTAAPLDIDLVNTRLSDEFFQRPGSYTTHVRRRSTPRTPRRFDPQIINSIDLNPPEVRHAPPGMTNMGRDNDSIAEVPRTPILPHEQPQLASDSEPSTRSASNRNPELNPYEAGYPYGGMQLAEYQRLVEVTKADEARRDLNRTRNSYM